MAINPHEFYSVKRSTSTVKKTMSLASLINPIDLRDIVSDNGDVVRAPLNILNKWSSIEIGFAQVETKDDQNVGCGASGRIEVTALQDLSKKTDRIEAIIIDNALKKASTPAAEQTNSVNLDILQTTINFLPKNMLSGKGKTVTQITKEFTIAQIFTAAQNLEAQANNPNNKYARLNQKQADALKIAVIMEYKDKPLWFKPSVTAVYKEDPDGFVKKIGEYVQTCTSKTDEGYLYFAMFCQMLKSQSTKFTYEYLTVDNATVEATSGGAYIDLYSVFKTPNVHKTDEDGLTKAYSINIKADPTRDYPYRVELTTMRGKPISDGNGGVKDVGIDATHAVDRKTFFMDLTSAEWTHAIYMACQIRDAAITNYYVPMYKTAINLEMQARNRARQNASVSFT